MRSDRPVGFVGEAGGRQARWPSKRPDPLVASRAALTESTVIGSLPMGKALSQASLYVLSDGSGTAAVDGTLDGSTWKPLWSGRYTAGTVLTGTLRFIVETYRLTVTPDAPQTVTAALRPEVRGWT